MQVAADVNYFLSMCGRQISGDEAPRLHRGVMRAYRWQHIASGIEDPRFKAALGSKIDAKQMQHIQAALEPLLH